MSKARYKTVFISDTHLGLKEARTEFLLDFLKHVDCETLYLVGDIIDFWKMRRSVYWPSINNEIVRELMDMAKHGNGGKGTRVVYVPGNHDELFRDYVELFFGGIEVQHEAIHQAADGKRYLVLHGDEFDCVVTNNKWLAYLGSEAYDALLVVNRYFNVVRRKLGMGYWSLSAFLKNQVKEAVKYIGSYEQAVVQKAREAQLDGVICGHIHQAALTDFDGVTYINTGDWVESCTAVTENEHGEMAVVHWVKDSARILDGIQAQPAPVSSHVQPQPVAQSLSSALQQPMPQSMAQPMAQPMTQANFSVDSMGYDAASKVASSTARR